MVWAIGRSSSWDTGRPCRRPSSPTWTGSPRTAHPGAWTSSVRASGLARTPPILPSSATIRTPSTLDRGPFEAAGVGLVGRKGDIAFRCNFATVDAKMNVLDRRAGRIKEPETTDLVRSLEGLEIDGFQAIVKEATEHRAVLLLRGEDLDPHVSDADPHSIAKVHLSEPLVPEAERTADAVNKFVQRTYEILDAHPVNVRRRREGLLPANVLLPRGGGPFPDIEPFESRHRMTASCVAGVSLIKGICRVCGLEIVEPPGDTGEWIPTWFPRPAPP